MKNKLIKHDSKKRSSLELFATMLTDRLGLLSISLLLAFLLAGLLLGGCCVMKCGKSIQDSRTRLIDREMETVSASSQLDGECGCIFAPEGVHKEERAAWEMRCGCGVAC